MSESLPRSHEKMSSDPVSISSSTTNHSQKRKRRPNPHGIPVRPSKKHATASDYDRHVARNVDLNDWIRTPGNTPLRGYAPPRSQQQYHQQRYFHGNSGDHHHQQQQQQQRYHSHHGTYDTSRRYQRHGGGQNFGNTPTPQRIDGAMTPTLSQRTPSRHRDWTPTPQRDSSSNTPVHYSARGGGMQRQGNYNHRNADTKRRSHSQFSESRYVKPSPVPTPTYRQNTRRNQRQHASNKKATSEWEEEEDDIQEQDRSWYTGDEGDAVDMTKDDQFVISREDKLERKEREYKKRASSKMSQMTLENRKWEENQLRFVGLGERKEVDLNYSTEEDVKVNIIVHDVKPSFISSDVAFSNQTETVEPVVDRTCDLAVSAKKGSQVLREVRSQRDKMNAVKDMLKMEGTQLGNLLGMSKKKEKKVTMESIKDDSRFSKTLKKTSSADGSTPSKEDLKEETRSTREHLPIYHCKDELLALLMDHPVAVVVGETGSGKTTQLAQYFHEAGYSKFGNVGCTQPRRVAAMSVAKRVSEEFGCEVGEEIGYAIRFEDCTSDKTIIKFMTDGVLLRECLSTPDLSKYSVVIMDEAHERSLNTDVLFGLLKGALARRRDLKLIVTSATMDATRFAEYFGNCPIYTIPGRTFPVKTMYTKTPITDYVDAAVKQAMSIHLNNDPSSGDILIFMTGQEDIEITCYILQEQLKEQGSNAPPMMVLPIYSMLPSEMQAKIFDAAPKGTRKCIIATNIAETSLTVAGIYYVIDTGFTKMKVFNPTISMDTLQVYPESRAAADQRAGRAGRTGPGMCFRLYTRYQFENEMLPSTMPEIQRTNLGNIVLLLKSLGINDVLEFDFMDPPPKQNMINSMHQLYILGALDHQGNLTELGARMVNFPVDPTLSKMLIFSEQLGCTNEIVIIISMLSVRNIFHRPKDREEEAEAAIEKFFVPESDHLTFLHIYNQWKLKDYSSQWCREHFVNYRSMRRVREIRAQIIDLMKKHNIRLISSGTDWDLVRKAVCSAYFHHVCKLKGIAEYTNLLAGMPCTLHPSSALYGMGYTPEYVVYHELVMTTKEYMRVATAVEGEWLAELAPSFFSVKEDKNRRQKQHDLREAMQKDVDKQQEKEMEILHENVMPPPKVSIGTRKSKKA
eukprot:CAMPEP_0117445936 /NCGR_PEP_ID=MMETSP0759-20121206/6065_1 /TAXON_ID=63605 /ORGANISM="Percolomonas cosmopolitus, Strain WS" /LENGTH=1134 /DNA_ID=CAMNT_0005238153 /DNA_START=100 /DNA_END=3500 /DNA_ORIENTATION=-